MYPSFVHTLSLALVELPYLLTITFLWLIAMYFIVDLEDTASVFLHTALM